MADHPKEMSGQVVGEHGAIAHTDDPSKYYPLPVASGSRLPSGAVVPRADKEGVSLGFRPNVPGILAVEPSDRATGQGGLQVDLGVLTPEATKQAYERAAAEAVSEEDRVMLAYQYLHEAAAAVAQEKQGETVVPIPPPSHGNPEPAVSGYPQPDPYPSVQPPTPQPERFHHSRLEQQLAQLSDVVTMLAQEQLRQKEEKVAVPEPEPEPQEELPTAEPAISEADVKARLTEAFASLNIPGLGPDPEKPQHKIIFDLGEGGKLSSWYHWVNEHEDGLFLIYDNRFEYGTVFEPPNLGKDRIIKVTHTNSQKEWQVFSLGFVQPFGVFTIINLVIDPTSAQPREVNYGHGSTEYES